MEHLYLWRSIVYFYSTRLNVFELFPYSINCLPRCHWKCAYLNGLLFMNVCDVCVCVCVFWTRATPKTKLLFIENKQFLFLHDLILCSIQFNKLMTIELDVVVLSSGFCTCCMCVSVHKQFQHVRSFLFLFFIFFFFVFVFCWGNSLVGQNG